MKTKIKPLWMLLAGVLFFGSCRKAEILVPVDENYWLQKDRGVVVYTDFSCNYYIVETRLGYSVIRNYGGLTPFSGDVLYGDLNRWGYTDIYNRRSGRIIYGDVKDYWLSWFNARDQVAYQCGR
jgi:hypothetical protein